MHTVNMVMNKMMSYEAFNLEISHHPRSTFMRRAADELAKKILADGCLVHQSEYDIRRGMHHEVITILTGRPERKLP